jgi:CBS domain-containing protein
MKVKEVMRTDGVTIHPQATLAEAAIKIQNVGPGPLPVVDKGQIQGMVTDQDMVRLKSEARDPSTPISQLMSPGILFCYDDQELPEALSIMKEQQVQKLLVLSRDRQLVGEVTLPALTQAYAERL